MPSTRRRPTDRSRCSCSTRSDGQGRQHPDYSSPPMSSLAPDGDRPVLPNRGRWPRLRLRAVVIGWSASARIAGGGAPVVCDGAGMTLGGSVQGVPRMGRTPASVRPDRCAILPSAGPFGACVTRSYRVTRCVWDRCAIPSAPGCCVPGRTGETGVWRVRDVPSWLVGIRSSASCLPCDLHRTSLDCRSLEF